MEVIKELVGLKVPQDMGQPHQEEGGQWGMGVHSLEGAVLQDKEVHPSAVGVLSGMEAHHPWVGGRAVLVAAVGNSVQLDSPHRCRVVDLAGQQGRMGADRAPFLVMVPFDHLLTKREVSSELRNKT